MRATLRRRGAAQRSLGPRGETAARDCDSGADGKLSVVPIETGLTDGQWTEISGEGIEEGMEAIAGVLSEETPATSNPFAAPQQQGPRRFGPRGF
jgi:hypothetical protein